MASVDFTLRKSSDQISPNSANILFFFFFPVHLNLLKVYGLVSVGNTRAPVPFAPYSLTMNLTVRKSDCRGSLVVKLSHILIHP